MNNRGVSYWHLGNMDAAKQCWEEALSLEPQHMEALINRRAISNKIKLNRYSLNENWDKGKIKKF